MTLPAAYRLPDLPRHHPFIAAEGCSGIGKSTLVHRLGQHFGARTLHMIPPPHSAMASYIASCDPITQLAFFLTGVRAAAATVNQQLASNAVISDRWVNSVLANHSAVNRVPLPDVRTLAEPFTADVPRPDITLYLHASEATLRARMAGKPDLSSSDLALLDRPGLLGYVIDLYDELADTDPTAVRLDCDDLDADQVFEHALKLWEARPC